MIPKISLTNSKLGGQIPSINLPPVITCRKDAPCVKGCYACKGHYLYENVRESLKNNLAAYISDKKAYFDYIIMFLTGLVSYKYFRYCSSGDIVDMDYLKGMVRVAQKCKTVKFLAFTKKFELVNEYLKTNKLPSNLKIVFSAWDKDFKVDNPHKLPVAYVSFKKEERNPKIPELSIPCVGHCESCQSCWSLKKGQSVVFHQH